MADNQFTIPTKYGDFKIHKDEYEPILGTQIGRVRTPNGERVEGFHTKPLVCWHAKYGQYSLHRDTHSLLRSIRYTKDWEGDCKDELPSSDHQKLLAWLQAHKNLQSWAMRLSTKEDKRFQAICGKLAADMGKPIDDVKVSIQTLTLQVALSENDDNVELLQDVIGLDARRIKTIKAIAKRIDIRAAVVLREIITQQTVMQRIYTNLPDLIKQHSELINTHRGREQHCSKVLIMKAGLAQVKDRPWYGLARNTERDLDLYLQQTTTGDFKSAVTHLLRADASGLCDRAIHKVNSASAYLGLAKDRKGHRHLELLAKAEGLIMHLTCLHTLESDLLSNNPLPSIVGRAKDALTIIRSERPDWGDVSILLSGMNDRLG
ncbi:MAG: hypothetical protein WAZ14_02650 [Patescibacteria group bacterium]